MVALGARVSWRGQLLQDPGQMDAALLVLHQLQPLFVRHQVSLLLVGGVLLLLQVCVADDSGYLPEVLKNIESLLLVLLLELLVELFVFHVSVWWLEPTFGKLTYKLLFVQPL